MKKLIKKILREGLSVPLDGNIHINSPYGPRDLDGDGVSKMHYGIDLRAKSGTPIRAPESGEVIKAEFNDDACGGQLYLKHPGGLKTRYCHVKEFMVDEGDSFEKGDVVALTGGDRSDTGNGNSRYAHLHYEVYRNGRVTDPEPYLDGVLPPLDDEEILDDETLEEVEIEGLIMWDGMSKGRREKKKEVREMQQLLIDRNYILPRFGVDGKFGPETLAAVKAFQKDYMDEVTGNVNDEMLEMLEDEENINKNPEANDPNKVKELSKKGEFEAFSQEVIDAIADASETYGVDMDILLTIANIESGGDPGAENRRSGASGLFQIMPKYFDSYGVTNVTVWDPYVNADAATKKLVKRIDKLKNFLKREPTPTEIYVSHNQGRAGFQIIYTACESYSDLEPEEALIAAAEELGYRKSLGKRVYKNMKGNKGDEACEFLDGWDDIYASREISVVDVV